MVLAGCSQAVQGNATKASQCVDIPDGQYFQVVDGKFILASDGATEVGEQPPETARRIATTLDRMGYPWMSIDWDGRIATVRGIASDEVTKSDAFIAAKAAFETDPVAGPKVSRVVNEISVRAGAGAVMSKLTNGFKGMGFPWMGLDIKGQVGTLTGTAPDAASKEAAYIAGKAAIEADADASQIVRVVVDGIAIEGGDAGVGSALSALGLNPTVTECQNAFIQTMDGRNVEFEVNEALISTISARLLDAATGVALLCKAHEIEIGGHTDSRGQDTYNLDLSQRRASAVQAYLTNLGVPADGLSARGYGETRPIDPAENDAAWTKNRRTEFTVRAR